LSSKRKTNSVPKKGKKTEIERSESVFDATLRDTKKKSAIMLQEFCRSRSGFKSSII
jgi:hypothetical protein